MCFVVLIDAVSGSTIVLLRAQCTMASWHEGEHLILDVCTLFIGPMIIDIEGVGVTLWKHY